MTPLLLTAALLQPAPTVDGLGDPLPPGALLRIGTARLRPGGVVTSMAFTPDGKKLVTANRRTGVHVWDVATGKELHHLANPSPDRTHVVLAPDGSRVVSRGIAGPWVVREVGTGKVLHTFDGLEDPLNITFTPDGNYLAEGDQFNVLLRKVGDKDFVVRCDFKVGFLGPTGGVAVAPDGKSLAVASWDYDVLRYEAAKGQRVGYYGRQDEDVGYRAAAFSPDGKRLAALRNNERAVDVWDVASGQWVRTWTGDFTLSHAIAFTADSRFLLAGHQDGTIGVWDVAAAREVRLLVGHTMTLRSIAVSPDGKTVATAAEDGTVRLWDVTTAKELLPLPGRQDRSGLWRFSADGTRLQSARRDGAGELAVAFHLWDAHTGKHLEAIPWDQDATRAALAADGRVLVTADEAGRVEVRHRATGKPLLKLALANCIIDQVELTLDAAALLVCLLQLPGDQEGRRLVQLWDVATGKKLVEVVEAPHDVNWAEFTADGWTLVVHRRAAGLHLVECYDTRSGRKLVRADLKIQPAAVAAVAPGARRIATAAFSDTTAVLYELATGKVARKLQAAGKHLDVLAFAPTGRLLAAGTEEGLILIWDVLTGQEVARLNGHRGGLRSLDWSPDGLRLLSFGRETTAIVWDAAPWYGGTRLP